MRIAVVAIAADRRHVAHAELESGHHAGSPGQARAASSDRSTAASGVMAPI